VGLSTFDGISDGEHLCPSQLDSYGVEGALGGGGSEGEPAGLPMSLNYGNQQYKTFDDVEDLFLDDDFGDNSSIKELVKGMLNKNNKKSSSPFKNTNNNNNHQNTLKSAGEISSPSNSPSSQLSMGQIPRSLLVDNIKKIETNDGGDTTGGVGRIGNRMGRNSDDEDTLNSVTLNRGDLEDTLTNNNAPLSRTRPAGTVRRVQPILVNEKRADNDPPIRQQQIGNASNKARTFSTDVISEGEAIYDQSSKLSDDLLQENESELNQSTPPTDTSHHQYDYGDGEDGGIKVTPRFVQVQSFDLDNDDDDDDDVQNGGEDNESGESNLEQHDISDVSEIQEDPNLSRPQDPRLLRLQEPRPSRAQDSRLNNPVHDSNLSRPQHQRLDPSDGLNNNDGQRSIGGHHSVDDSSNNGEDSTSEGQVKHLPHDPFHHHQQQQQQQQQDNNLRSSLMEGNYGDVTSDNNDDDDNISSAGVHDDLSEYDLSTLSGGEL